MTLSQVFYFYLSFMPLPEFIYDNNTIASASTQDIETSKDITVYRLNIRPKK